MSTPVQQDFFASLDFPGRTTLYLHEIAMRIGVTVKHLLDQVEEGKLVGLDVSSADSNRRAMRVPVECYRNYVLCALTGPVDFKLAFLRALPAATRRQLIDELNASLKHTP